MNQVNILLVEDNVADQRLTIEGLKAAGIEPRLRIADNGDDAVAILHEQKRAAGDIRTQLIILDLNLPRKDGREVLDEIKRDEHLRHIPVIVLTTSEAREDVVFAYRLGANCYLTKRPDLDEFWGLMRAVADFWLHWVNLPPSSLP